MVKVDTPGGGKLPRGVLAEQQHCQAIDAERYIGRAGAALYAVRGQPPDAVVGRQPRIVNRQRDRVAVAIAPGIERLLKVNHP